MMGMVIHGPQRIEEDMRAKWCEECGKSSAFTICAQCSAKHVRATPRVSVGHYGQYGYRLTKGFILMHFEDDEYVSPRDRGVRFVRPGDGPVVESPENPRPWPSRWWKDD